MKIRVLAVLLIAGSVAAPYQAAEAGALTDALRNKLGTAVFLGHVAKGVVKDGVRRAVNGAVDFAWRHG